MGRWRDDEQTRRNRTGSYPGSPSGGYDRRRGYEHRDYREQARYGPYYDREGARFYEDDQGRRYYDEDYDSRYYRERDREREGYWREREQRQETRRTGIMVIGGICVAVIALISVMALTSGEDSSQTAQQAPQQAPQQQPAQPQQPNSPAAPQVPQQPDGASSEQVEGLRADLERQLAEIRSSINQLRLEIWSFFTSQQSQQEQEQ